MSSQSEPARYRTAILRTLPSLVDERAKYTPSQPFASIPTQDWRTISWQDVSYGQAARAIDALAYWLLERLGPSTHSTETITYIGSNDLRYSLIIFAAVKVNRCVCFVIRLRCATKSSASTKPVTGLATRCNATRGSTLAAWSNRLFDHHRFR